MDHVQLGALALGRRIASGSQGEILEVLDDPGLVAKIYTEQRGVRLVPEALDELVHLGPRITLDGAPVVWFAAWPLATVLDGPRPVGFLMPRVHEPFMTGIGPSARLAELGLLIAGQTVGAPGAVDRVLVLRALAAAIDALHQHGLVFGDLSPRNIAWSAQPEPRVMLLDCDGIRRPGKPGVLPHAETHQWEDPATLGHPPTADSDRYKLALAVARVLAANPAARPGIHVDLGPVAEAGVLAQPLAHLLETAAGPPGTRPTAAQWVGALDVRGVRRRRRFAPPPSTPLAPPQQPDLLRPYRLPAR